MEVRRYQSGGGSLLQLTPRWHRSTSGNKLISKKRKLGIKRKQQKKDYENAIRQDLFYF